MYTGNFYRFYYFIEGLKKRKNAIFLDESSFGKDFESEF